MNASTSLSKWPRRGIAVPPGTVTQEGALPMHDQPIQEGSEQFARLDRAILGLLLANQRDWSDAEIISEIGDHYGDVPASLDRLQRDGLVERSGDQVRPSRAVVRADEILTL